MKRTMAGFVAALGLACGLAGTAAAQDRAGLALGGFYEMRVDNNVDNEDLSLDYYGVRFQVRDERWFNLFVDLGLQSAEWGDYDTDASGFFGIGGTLWLARAEDLAIPLDLGLFGSFHRGDVDLKLDGETYDGTYSKVVGQGVIRAMGYGMAKPFLRAGVMKSKLDASDLPDDGDWDEINPAVNVGLEIEPSEQITLTLEANYSESAGFGVHADFWF
jgi:opacity protein-like surface antigen